MLTQTAFQFFTPAMINDFPNNPALQELLAEQWTTNLNGFTQQAMAGNTWNTANTPPPPNYYNPVNTSPGSTVDKAITWLPFPGRLRTYFGNNPQITETNLLELADTGYYTDGSGNKQTFPAIPQYPCSVFNSQYFSSGSCGCVGSPKATIPFGPYGPRGWQDEYCEWSVERDTNNNITRIEFTCENPEYWNTLWMIDPETVLSLYQSTLGKPQIKLADLYLIDQNGKPVIDPGTGRPAYNPLNKWNSGTVSNSSGGGAMHLTSTPNTLQTEIGLAAAATVLRNYPQGGQIPASDIQSLICSAQYGQFGRNSDPNIGAGVNGVAALGTSATLYNPPGLYLQLPAGGLNSVFKIPGVSDVTPYFTVSRGGKEVTISTGITYNLNLHLTVQAPQGMPPLSKLQCYDPDTQQYSSLQWAGQISKNLQMLILAEAFKSTSQTPYACNTPLAIAYAQPLQLFHEGIFTAMVNQNIPNPVGFTMSLLSNSTYIAPLVKPNTQYNMVLTYAPSTTPSDIDPKNPATWPTVTFADTAIKATIKAVNNNLTYAVPGNSYPSPAVALLMSVSVGAASTGLQGLYVTDVKQSGKGAIMPALLNVIN
jgi:hypothetical protein